MGTRELMQERKRECWQSPWRVVRRDPITRMPTHYVVLTQQEMMVAATTGQVRIPDAHMPQIVLDEREELRKLEGQEELSVLDAIQREVERVRG